LQQGPSLETIGGYNDLVIRFAQKRLEHAAGNRVVFNN
jgi:hypothetical protein